MLSDEEIQEMLADANDVSRRDSFRFSKKNSIVNISFDEYLNFLNEIQQIFLSARKTMNITRTALNKL